MKVQRPSLSVTPVMMRRPMALTMAEGIGRPDLSRTTLTIDPPGAWRLEDLP